MWIRISALTLVGQIKLLKLSEPRFKRRVYRAQMRKSIGKSSCCLNTVYFVLNDIFLKFIMYFSVLPPIKIRQKKI